MLSGEITCHRSVIGTGKFNFSLKYVLVPHVNSVQFYCRLETLLSSKMEPRYELFLRLEILNCAEILGKLSVNGCKGIVACVMLLF